MTTAIYSQEEWTWIRHTEGSEKWLETDVLWKLENGILEIKGKGAIPNYQHTLLYLGNTIEAAPWFSKRSSITSVIIEVGITWIGDAAFYKCENLTSVNIPSSVTGLGAWAFADCNKLTSIVIPDDVTFFGSQVFLRCKNLISVNIPAKIENNDVVINPLDRKQFQYQYSRQKLGQVFMGCDNLTTVDLSEGMIIIPDGLFSNSSLTSITIPASVCIIGNSTFQGCEKLAVVEVKNPIPPKAEKGTFWQSPIKKAKLIVPAGTKETYAASKVWKDFGIIEENPLTVIHSTPKKQISRAYTPNITWRIENDTLFINGEGDMPKIPSGKLPIWANYRDFFTSVVIDEGITKIGPNTFNLHKNIHSVTIAESVTDIAGAFFQCKNLSIMEVKSVVPPKLSAYGEFLFTPISKAKLIVPNGAKSQYETDKGWSKFGTIEEKDIQSAPKKIQSAPTETLSEPCVIHLKRTKNLMGAARKVQVFLNGIEQGLLKNNQTIVIQTDRVKNLLQIKQGDVESAILRFDATIGGEIHIDYHYLVGYMKVIKY